MSKRSVHDDARISPLIIVGDLPSDTAAERHEFRGLFAKRGSGGVFSGYSKFLFVSER
jgi:hypothetical protein